MAKRAVLLLLAFMAGISLFAAPTAAAAEENAGAARVSAPGSAANGAGYVIEVTKKDIDELGAGAAIQNALDEAARKGTADAPCTVKVQAGTYTLTKSSLSIGSNTTLELTGVTLKRSGMSARGFSHNMVFLGLKDQRYPDNLPSTGAKGYAFTNIAIRGGTLDGGGGNTTMLKICHASGVTLSGVTLTNAHNAHLVEIAGAKDVAISGCNFSNQALDVDVNRRTLEAIQLDVLSSTHIFGYRAEPLAMQNIKITNCTFRNVPRGVGGHTLIQNCPISGVTVSGCTFSDIKSAAIFTYGWTNCDFSGNVITNTHRGVVVGSISERGGNVFQPSAVAAEGKVTTSYPDGYIAPAADQKIVIDNNKVTLGATPDPYGASESSGVTVVGEEITGATGIPKGNYYISGVKITNNTIDGIGHGIRLLNARNSDISGNNVTFSGSSGNYYGISAGRTSNGGSITGNTVRNAKVSAIAVYGSSVNDVTGNTIEGAGKYGVEVRGKATVTRLDGNTVSGTKDAGITVYEQSTAAIRNNGVSGSGSHGVAVLDGSTVTVSDNTITSPGSAGIYGSASTVTASGNSVTKSANNSIHLNSCTGSKLSGNTVSGSKAAGIRIVNGSDVTVGAGNKVTNSATQGISVQDSKATVTNNTVESSGKNGVYLDGATFAVKDNTVKTSAGSNIYVKDSEKNKSSGSITDNKLFGSGISDHSTGKVTESGNIVTVNEPKLTGVTVTPGAVKIAWEAVPGTPRYRVYYKTGDSGWTRIADTSDLSYTWKDAAGNRTYAFTVRGVSADGKSFTSDYDKTGISVKVPYLATPAVSSLSNTGDGVKIAWGAVEGAAKYRVYRRNDDGGWTRIADTASASYTWTGAQNGTEYTFTVRCVTSDGKDFTSDYDRTGKSITYHAAPTVEIENAADGIRVSWNAVSGSPLYMVYYKENDGDWHRIGTTANTTYTRAAKHLEEGATYQFTVRCCADDKTTLLSGYKASNALVFTG